MYQDQGDQIPRPVGYSDADYASDPKDRKSFTGYAFLVNGAVVSLEVQETNCRRFVYSRGRIHCSLARSERSNLVPTHL